MASNETILERLRNGTAHFELASSPVASISISAWTSNNNSPSPSSSAFLADNNNFSFFARIGPSLGSPALKKAERYVIKRVTGDGRCMFRALAKGMAMNKGITLSPWQERENADELRMAVKEVICEDKKERLQYEEALIAITVDESLRRYCRRIGRSDFWGGESELLVLSKLCKQTVIVYIPAHEHRGGASGFIPIAEYGAEFSKRTEKVKARKPVRLVYSGTNHYDLLV